MLKKIRNDHALFTISIAATFLLVLLVGGVLASRTPGYRVYINGKQAFVVKDNNQVADTVAKIQAKEEKDCRQKLEIASKIVYKPGLVFRNSILDSAHLEQELEQTLQFRVTAGAIVVNGKTVACVESPAAASKLLGDLKKEYSQVDEGEKLVGLSFAEKVKVEPRKISQQSVTPVNKASQLIATGSRNPEKYVVKDGDSLWLIARRNDMYVDDIKKANHLTGDDLQLDQELILVKSKPYINVIARVEGAKTEEIPYETKVITDKNSPNRLTVKQEGRNGQKHVVYQASKRNGVVDKKQVVEEKILQAAVDKIIVKGTKVVLASRGGGGSGILSWPAYATITQYYSGRHPAIDIGVRSGTPIQAADSGYVTSAGYDGGYGLLVTIDHGNGLVTRYAHCSKLTVSRGQHVNKGETIAYSGSTGHSTGPHLHFEVLSRGSTVNPLSYLR